MSQPIAVSQVGASTTVTYADATVATVSHPSEASAAVYAKIVQAKIEGKVLSMIHGAEDAIAGWVKDAEDEVQRMFEAANAFLFQEPEGAPPADNEHVAPGAEPFSEPKPPLAAAVNQEPPVAPA